MSIEAVEAVIDLIELGAVATKDDIVKCLRSAIAEVKKQKPLKILQDMEEALDDAYADGIRNAKRELVWLTDKEIEDCYKQGGIGRAIQMLKEKNT